MATVVNGGTQSYNGMLISVQHRPNRGINLNGNYTWSHCVGDYAARSSNGFGTSVDHTYQDRNNRRRDRGNCEIDQRHSFNLTAVAETPKFANHTLSLVGSGWRLSGIYPERPHQELSSHEPVQWNPYGDTRDSWRASTLQRPWVGSVPL